MATTAEKTLTDKQRAFVVALMESPTIQAAAHRAGISETTAHRYLNDDPILREEFRKSRRGAIEVAGAQLAGKAGIAVQVLAEIALNEAAPAASRVGAADKILGHLIRLQEMDGLEAKLNELEAALEAVRR